MKFECIENCHAEILYAETGTKIKTSALVKIRPNTPVYTIKDNVLFAATVSKEELAMFLGRRKLRVRFKTAGTQISINNVVLLDNNILYIPSRLYLSRDGIHELGSKI